MFIGHYALALAAKRAAPRTSLGATFAAAQLADLMWPVLLLLGWEQSHVAPSPNPFLVLWLDSIPISHSLLTLVAWGLAFAAVYRARTAYPRGAAILALLVVSHWVLDVATHRPDMPLYPGGPRLGLGLWRSAAATVIVEAALLAGGLWIYAGATRSRDRIGRYGYGALVAVLVLSYAGSIAGGPPPSMRVLELGGIVFGWLFVAWAWWADRHRDAVFAAPATSPG
jgi:hypothetical protein